MATLVGSPQSSAQNVASSWSPSVDCTGVDLLAITMHAEDGGAGNPTVSTITYNSVSMNLAIKGPVVSSNTCFVYYLFAPTTGTNTLALTWSGNTNFSAWVTRYSGISGGSLDTTNSGSSTNVLTATATITPTVNDCVLIGAAYGFRVVTSVSTTSSMVRATAHAGNNYGVSMYKDGSYSAGANDFTFNSATSDPTKTWAMASFKPAAGAATPSRLMMLGVG